MGNITVSGSKVVQATSESTKTIIVAGVNDLATASFAGLTGATPSSYDNQVVLKNIENVLAPTPSPTKLGFAFVGWSPSLPRTISQNTIFTAVFEQLATVTASFDSNGGTPTFNDVSGFEPLAVAVPGTVTRTGYTFTNWFPSLPTTITENTTFTAQWNAKNYTISFNPATGGDATNASVTYDDPMPTNGYYFNEFGDPVLVFQMTEPSQPGNTFRGYWDGSGGTGNQYYNDNMTSFRTWNKDQDNVTLYAKFCLNIDTYISQRCVGFDLYRTYADGNCGTYETLYQSNSTTCGYIPPTPTYNITEDKTNINETTDRTVTFTVTTTNVSNGTILYWTIAGVSGSISNTDFSSPANAVTSGGSVTISSGQATFSLTAQTDFTAEGTEIFEVNLRTGSSSGTIVATSSEITIADTSFVQTLEPTISFVSRTTSSISFNIKNNEVFSSALIRYDIDALPSSSSLDILLSNDEISGTLSFSGLQSNTTYFVYADALRDGATRSNVDSLAITTLQQTTATPTTATNTATQTSVTFDLTNNDGNPATITWQIRVSSTSGTIVASGTTSSLGTEDTATVGYYSATGSTTYYLTGVRATATNKLQSALATVRSLTTLAQSQKDFVFITFSSSEFSYADYSYICGSCSGISDAYNFLDANYDPNSFDTGEYIEVLDGSLVYILFQVQEV